MDEIEIKRLPTDLGVIPCTREEAFNWMIAFGRVMTVERDGVLYRVLEPDEDGAPQ